MGCQLIFRNNLRKKIVNPFTFWKVFFFFLFLDNFTFKFVILSILILFRRHLTIIFFSYRCPIKKVNSQWNLDSSQSLQRSESWRIHGHWHQNCTQTLKDHELRISNAIATVVVALALELAFFNLTNVFCLFA